MRVPFQFSNKGKNILGVMHIAEHQRKTPVVLVMCYGLNGDRVIQHQIAIKLGDTSERCGINLVRFDYRNSGVSEGRFEFTTFEERVEDIVEICGFCQACFGAKDISILLLGFSDGARNAIEASFRADTQGLILWNPILNYPHSAIAKRNSQDKLLIHPLLNIPVKQLLGVGLNVKLIKTLQSEQSLKKLETYKSPILFVFGSRDSTTVGLQQYLNEIDYCARTHVQINIIEGADHLFGIAEHIDQVILQTNNWIYTNY